MCVSLLLFILFFFTDPAPTEIYTLSLHDALPISELSQLRRPASLYALAAPGWSGTLASRTASFGLKSLKAGWTLRTASRSPRRIFVNSYTGPSGTFALATIVLAIVIVGMACMLLTTSL